MMLTAAELIATLGLDDRAFERGLDRSLGQGETRIQRFGTMAKGALAAGIGGGLLAVAHTGYQEVMDAAKVQAQIEAGIKSTGGAANVTTDHLEDLAGAIQEVSGQTDDSIAQAEALLLTFTNIRNVGADKIFDETTRAAADMAAKMGGEASGYAIQLGKALNDPVKGVTALQRVGVSFTEDQKKQIKVLSESGRTLEAQKIILAELTKEFGGAAKAAGESLPGQVERTKRAFEDVSQELVTQAVPVLKSILGILRSLTPHIGTIIKLGAAFGGLWVAVKGYKVLKDASGAVSDITGWLRRGRGAADSFAGGLRGARSVSGGLAKTLGKGGALALALAFTTTMIFKAVDAWRQYRAAAEQAEQAYQGAKGNYEAARAAAEQKYGKGSEKYKHWLDLNAGAKQGIEDDRYQKPWWLPFAKGGDFITRGPTPILVGDNPGGRERVTITPLGSAGGSAGHGRTTNIYITGVPSRRQLEALKRDLACVDIGGY